MDSIELFDVWEREKVKSLDSLLCSLTLFTAVERILHARTPKLNICTDGHFNQMLMLMLSFSSSLSLWSLFSPSHLHSPSHKLSVRLSSGLSESAIWSNSDFILFSPSVCQRSVVRDFHPSHRRHLRSNCLKLSYFCSCANLSPVYPLFGADDDGGGVIKFCWQFTLARGHVRT